MKELRELAGVVLLALVLLALAFKGVQTVCWRNQVSFFPAPSLDAWDPTERVEAARQAAQKYGGAKE